MWRSGPRILLFSGSFDPVHHGHLRVADLAAHELAATHVLFFPHRSRAGKTLAPLEARMRALRRALSLLSIRQRTGACREAPGFSIADEVLLATFHQDGMLAVARVLLERQPKWVPVRITGSDSAQEALAAGTFDEGPEDELRRAVVVRPGFDVGADRLPPGVIVLPSSGVEMSSSRIRSQWGERERAAWLSGHGAYVIHERDRLGRKVRGR